MQSSGGEGTFDAFYRAEAGRLVGALRLITADRALSEDLAQEAMVRAYRSWDRVRTMEAPAGWLHTVAVNLVRRHHRRRRPSAGPTHAGSADPAALAGDHTDIRQALARLPEDQRTVVVLRHVLGYPTVEAATMLGRTPEATRALLHRAVSQLRGDLKEHQP